MRVSVWMCLFMCDICICLSAQDGVCESVRASVGTVYFARVSERAECVSGAGSERGEGRGKKQRRQEKHTDRGFCAVADRTGASRKGRSISLYFLWGFKLFQIGFKTGGGFPCLSAQHGFLLWSKTVVCFETEGVKRREGEGHFPLQPL